MSVDIEDIPLFSMIIMSTFSSVTLTGVKFALRVSNSTLYIYYGGKT